MTSATELQPEPPPPTYEEATDGDALANTSVRDDGRIDVNFGSRLDRALHRIARHPPRDGKRDPLTQNGATKSDNGDDFPLRLSVVLQVVGSRGDVQPFIALGVALQQHGHRIRLASHDKFRSVVTQSGLEFYSIGGHPEDLMAYMVKNPGLVPSMASLREGDISRKREMIAQMLDGCWRSCIKPDETTGAPFVADAIIANPPSFAHVHCAEALGIPLHMVFTMPWSATSAFAHPLANIKGVGGGHQDRRLANYASWLVVGSLTWSGLGDIVNIWRKDSLGLEAVPATEGPTLVDTLRIPHTYCWSPALVPKPDDWSGHIDISGFCFREPPAYTPSKELYAFLNAGPPPIYIGFGSIVLENTAELSGALVEAVTRCGQRAIISPGWSGLHVPTDLADFFSLEECPHEWLFQRVSMVVHHGGAGTTAIGLREARPTIIVPFFGDQPFWGEMVAASGVGPKPIPQAQLSVERLIEAIRYCQTPAAQQAASAISAQIRQEAGVEAAVRSFHANLPLEQQRCKMLTDQPATWTLKLGGKHIPTSRPAAEVLIAETGLDPRNLKPYRPNPIYITNRRWDPATGVASSLAATGVGMVDGATGIFLRPMDELRRSRDMRAPESANRASSSSPESPERPNSCGPISYEHGNLTGLDPDSFPHTSRSQHMAKQGEDKGGYAVFGSMAAASGRSLGKFFTSFSRGMLIDMPLAAAEGFRAMPRLWGGDVKDYGPVTDWQSGAVVAGKTFVHSIDDGWSNIVKGSQNEGTLGVVKGAGSLVCGTAGATLGLVFRPIDGISRSLYSWTHNLAMRKVEEARHEEGRWQASQLSAVQRSMIVDAYHEAQRKVH